MNGDVIVNLVCNLHTSHRNKAMVTSITSFYHGVTAGPSAKFLRCAEVKIQN